ncbi:uncharacterized protein TRAVEDRAFT_47625 [Trametes versicolor FP-101664 SS1]|uniref:uncharacterized protein n=1 Tax=Trametes versicolor (strain FP-101664) TaxID=717944 RepID=UPI00046245ED|nr:uncharacterized protein TRAVEDRAFT_47625 [Trametes versicolor FP-101664 SS1]EIW58475.1 hypothetical protein TRAVEDRAFT_47625 [Trametes versicolor FP-101664 SS1]
MSLNSSPSDCIEPVNTDKHKTRRVPETLQVTLQNLGSEATPRFFTFDANSERVDENTALIEEQKRHASENGGKSKDPFNTKKWWRARATMKSLSKNSTPQRKRGRAPDITARYPSAGGGGKQKRPSRSTRPPSPPPAHLYAQRPSPTANGSVGRETLENIERAYAAHPSRATTGILSGAPPSIYTTTYQTPPWREPISERPYRFPPQSWQAAASSEPVDVRQVSARHHVYARGHHRDAAYGLPYYPYPSPLVIDETDGDPFAHPAALSDGASARHSGPEMYDSPPMYDSQGRDVIEKISYNIHPQPSYQLNDEETFHGAVDSHRGLAHTDTSRLTTRVSPPTFIREDQAQHAPTYGASRLSEQHAAHARIDSRSADYYGPSHLGVTYNPTYSDILRSDTVPHYAGSSSSSDSELPVDAPYGLSGAPAYAAPWTAPTAPTPDHVFAHLAHQHQAVSFPSAGFPSIPDQLPSTRADFNTSPVDLLDRATAYDQPFSDNAREAYLQHGWQMHTHAPAAFTPEQPALDHSATDRYPQDAQSASLYAQDYDAQGHPIEPQFPDLQAGHQREQFFMAKRSPSSNQQEARRQLPYDAAEPPLSPRAARAQDFAQAAHYLRIALHPGSISPNVYPAPLEQSPLVGDLLHERSYESHDPHLRAASFAQPYGVRFFGDTDPRQVSSLLARGEHEHDLVVEGPSLHNRQGAHPASQLLSYDAALSLNSTPVGGPPVWASERDGDLRTHSAPVYPVQTARYQEDVHHPKMIPEDPNSSSMAYPPLFDFVPAVTSSPSYEAGYDNTEGVVSYFVPEGDPYAADSSSYAFSQGSFVLQQLNVPHPRMVDAGIDVSQLNPCFPVRK